MKKRAMRFDVGGMASSGPQSAFYQQRNPTLPLPIGGTVSAPLPGPLDLGQSMQPMQPMQPTQQMRKGGKVKPKAYAKGGAVKSRGDGCAQRGKTKGMMR